MTDTPAVFIIAAIDERRGMGKNNDLLFRISEDLQRFKTLTVGHPVIMGRKTYESIGRPLPKRTNIVVTRDKSYTADGCIVCNSFVEALEKARECSKDHIFVIGGGDLFSQALPIARRLYLTLVKGTHDADVFFPDYSTAFHEVSREDRAADGYEYSYVTMERT